jgi:cytochrome c oxidase cbb3-type subunit 4
MYKTILNSIDDAGLFAIVAILIFFVFFIGLLVYVVRMKKSYVSHMAEMPFNDEQPNATE